jgi:hypothetical protein
MNSLCRYVVWCVALQGLPDFVTRTLAQEEAGIVSVALRPGMVDTSVSILTASPQIYRDVSPVDASNYQVNRCFKYERSGLQQVC